MGNKVTRRRFLGAMGAGITYLALTNAVGCEALGNTSKVRPLRIPKVGPVQIPRNVWPLPNISSAPSNGAWAFRSRPDFSPPAVEVATQAHSQAPGYIFVAPEKGDAGQGGSLILDDRGQVVWFRPLEGTYGRAHDFKVQSYRGTTVLTWMDGVDEYVIFDHSYYEIARIKAGNGYNGDHHEFLISPQDTALITIYTMVPWDLSPF